MQEMEIVSYAAWVFEKSSLEKNGFKTLNYVIDAKNKDKLFISWTDILCSERHKIISERSVRVLDKIKTGLH